MNYLDIILVAPILIGAWKGYKAGIVIELFTLLALLVGIYAAINFSDYMVNILKSNADIEGEYLPVTAFVLTFLLVGAMVYFLGKVVEKAIKVVQLGTLNKFIGLLFGATKFLFISGVVVVILESIDQKNQFISADIKKESVLYEPIMKFTTGSIPALKDSHLFNHTFTIEDVLNELDQIGE